MLKKIFIPILLLLISITNSFALEYSKKNEHIKFKILPEYTSISTSTKQLVVLSEIDIALNWHLYWKNPGDTGEPTEQAWQDSIDYSLQQQDYSIPKKAIYNDIITTYVYENKAYIRTIFQLNELNKEKKLHFNTTLSYTACKEECLPEKVDISFSIPIKNIETINEEYAKETIWAENYFPLPLNTELKNNNNIWEISLPSKTLEHCPTPEFISNHPKKDILADLPTTSIIDNNTLQISFNDQEPPSQLDGILLCNNFAYQINKTTFSAPNTTNQPTNSLLYYILISLLAGLILNLMPCVLPIISLKALYLASHKEKATPLSALLYLAGVLSSFVVLASLLYGLKSFGSNIGWGFQLQSPIFNSILLIMFIIIFLMMIDKLPLSVKFADKLDKLSAHNSFLTGFFAVLIATPCTGPFMGAALGYAFTQPFFIYFSIFISLGLGYALPYVLIEFFPNTLLKFIPHPGAWMNTLKHILSLPIALTCLWLGWIIYHQTTINTSANILWENYSKEKVEQALNKNEKVFIDFTAKWCLVCLMNDKTVLSSDTFKQLVNSQNIHLFKADWTNHNPEITTALKSYNRNSIPLYIYYSPTSKTPTYLPQILNFDTLKNTFK